MEKRILFFTVLALFSLALADEVDDKEDAFYWGYSQSDTSGPNYWGQHYPLCNGQKQSPINIEPKKAVYSQYLSKQPLQLLGYEEPLAGFDIHLKNNGHSVAVSIDSPQNQDHETGLAQGGLPGQYILKQMHWHWGKNDSYGSEHTYGGKRYPMEMHLVHLNRRYLKDTNAIETNQEGIAVLGVFIEVGKHNPAFDPIVQYLHASSDPDATEFSVPITLPSLREFLPADLTKYYRYQGSLTTPPCFEAVIWTVLKEPIQISQEQLNEFRTKLKKNKSANNTPSASNLIVDNWRPVMPLGDRVTFTSYSDDTTGVLESDTLHTKNWGYGGEHGLAPHEWDKKFEQCSGNRQSPVHIEHSEAIPSVELSSSPWNLKNYDSLPKDVEILLENNGHTVVVGMGDGVGVSGGGLPGDYRLLQFHIHWGGHNGNGSEHILNGRQYPAEIHLVHTNMYYGAGKDFNQIEANHDGLAVLGVFIEVGEHNSAFDPIINQLSKVKYESAQRVHLTFQSLRELLPKDMNEFYRYAGSLTTPPCYEIVVWTVFKNTIKMSQEQLNQLRTQVFDAPSPNSTTGHGPDGHSGEPVSLTDNTTPAAGTTPKPLPPSEILDNFRPLQDIGFRVVKYAKILPDVSGVSSSCRLSLSAYCLMLCAAVLLKSLA